MATLFNTLRVLLSHGDPLLAAGINAALMGAPGVEVVVTNDASTIPAVEVVVCDYDSGMAWARHRQSATTEIRLVPRVVIVTWRASESDVRTALQGGVGGYLLENCGLTELVDAVRTVGRGSPHLCNAAATLLARSLVQTPLTLRENDVLRLMADGLSNKSIASELDIALGTVKAHVKSILDKLDAKCRTEATMTAAQRGLVQPRSSLRPTCSPPQRPPCAPVPVQAQVHPSLATA